MTIAINVDPRARNAAGAALLALREAGRRAPSGDNLQPWQIESDSVGRRLLIHLDESRDRSPMNAGQRMSHIAIGAVVENIVVAAESRGWRVKVDDTALPVLVELLEFSSSGIEDPAIAKRVTNRRTYLRQAASPETIALLEAAIPALGGVRTLWICDPGRIAALAGLIARADTLMFSLRSARKSFLENVRFDRPLNEEVSEGLPLGSLEVGPMDRAAMRILGYLPNLLVRLAGIPRKIGAVSQRNVASSSGVSMILQAELSARVDIQSGRATQRAWLELARQSLAAQPMMSLVVLANMLQHGQLGESSKKRLRGKCQSLLHEFQEIVSEQGSDHLAFMMRFGYASDPSARTGRRQE